MSEPYGLTQRKALIRYYLGTNPTSADEFCEQWQELLFALRFDGKIKIQEVKKG